MTDRQPGLCGGPVGPLPSLEIAPLYPRPRAAGLIVERRERDPAQVARLEVPVDSNDFAVLRSQLTLQEFGQRSGVEQAPDFRRDSGAAQGQPQGPEDRAANHRGGAGAEDFLDLQLAPQPGEILGRRPDPGRMAGEERGVDRSGRDAGDDSEPVLRGHFRHTAQQADLVGRAGAAPAEHDRDLAHRRVGSTASLSRAVRRTRPDRRRPPG